MDRQSRGSLEERYDMLARHRGKAAEEFIDRVPGLDIVEQGLHGHTSTTEMVYIISTFSGTAPLRRQAVAARKGASICGTSTARSFRRGRRWRCWQRGLRAWLNLDQLEQFGGGSHTNAQDPARLGADCHVGMAHVAVEVD